MAYRDSHSLSIEAYDRPRPPPPPPPPSSSPRPKKKRGGWRAIKYILGNESFEKLASVSLIANITVYLRTRYHLEGVLLVNVVQIWSGGIRPCNIAFGADQFNTTTEKGRAQLESFFNWWYFSFTIALVVALTAVVYIQTNVSWIISFAIPTACLALSIAIFLFGQHTYIYLEPQGSVFVDIVKVFVAAFRKRRETVDESNWRSCLYDPQLDKSRAGSKKLEHTNALFKCLDKAALVKIQLMNLMNRASQKMNGDFAVCSKLSSSSAY
ncbi:hypothetical protein QQ045_029760 [Rhodiola kirilowii]